MFVMLACSDITLVTSSLLPHIHESSLYRQNISNPFFKLVLAADTGQDFSLVLKARRQKKLVGQIFVRNFENSVSKMNLTNYLVIMKFKYIESKNHFY